MVCAALFLDAIHQLKADSCDLLPALKKCIVVIKRILRPLEHLSFSFPVIRAFQYDQLLILSIKIPPSFSRVASIDLWPFSHFFVFFQ